MICHVDSSEHATLEDLHKWLRKLKVTQEVYYTAHSPVRDRHTGEPIPFKAPAADYVRREFTSKVTLKQWLKANPEAGRDWALDWLAARVADKDLKVAPCQAELRSVPAPCPDVRYYESQFDGGYAAVCEWLKLEARFGGQLPAAAPLPGPVVIDTREQKPLEFAVPSVRGALRSADYGLEAEHDQQVYIERKSLADLLGTMSDRETRPGDSNLARFARELARIEEIGAYMVLLVEAPLSECLAFNSIPYLKRQLGKVRITPEHVFHNLRDLLQQFPRSFQPLFVANRAEASAAVVRLLAAGDAIKSVDLQLSYDTKTLVLT